MNDPRVPPPEAIALAFSEPPAQARAVWPELAAGMERLDALRAKQVEYDQEVVRLRESLTAVRVRDESALGKLSPPATQSLSQRRLQSKRKSNGSRATPPQCSRSSPRRSERYRG
jgi:hypothetical protein